MSEFDIESPLDENLTTAHKALAAFLSFLGTYVAVFVADISDAASWVNQALIVVGGAVGTAVTYWTKNRPKL